jgi:hypothetical protein
MHLAVRKLGVNLVGHEQHFPRGLLVRVIVARKIAFHMAEVALHTKRRLKRLHDSHQVLWVQDLQVLGRGHLVPGTLGMLLRKRSRREQHSRKQ